MYVFDGYWNGFVGGIVLLLLVGLLELVLKKEWAADVILLLGCEWVWNWF